MKHLSILIIITLLCIGCAPSSEDKSPESQASKEAIAEEFSMMDDYYEIVSVIQLSPSETTTLEQGFRQREEDLTNWLEGPKGQKLIELETKLREQTEAKDLSGVRATIAQSKPLRQEIVDMIKSSRNDLLDSLGPERRLEWDAHKVSKKMLDLMQPLGLDETQIADIRYAAVDELRRAQQLREPNPQAASFLQLERWVEDTILDNPQYDTYQALKVSKPMRSLGF